MANAAGGHPIMVIVGLDEDGHRVVPLDATDPADWWPQMQKQFAHDVSPDLTVLRVPTDHGPVMCLHFETERAPYLVKVSGGWATTAVPWRSGTRTRTATRAELLSLLHQEVGTPQLEFVSAEITLVPSMLIPHTGEYAGDIDLVLTGTILIDIAVGTHIVLPEHRWIFDLNVSSVGKLANRVVSLQSTSDSAAADGVTSRRIGLVVQGPDLVQISHHSTHSNDRGKELAAAEWIDVELRLPIGTGERAAVLKRRFTASPDERLPARFQPLARWEPSGPAGVAIHAWRDGSQSAVWTQPDLGVD